MLSYVSGQADSRFTAEELRALHYLSTQTAQPLQRILEETLLTPHILAIINNLHSGLDIMIDTDKIQDLARLYKLFTKVSTGLPALRKALKDTLAVRGKEINTAAIPGGGEDEGGGGEDDDGPSTNKGKGKGKEKVAGGGAQLLQLALKWVEDVLRLKDKFDGIWEHAFASDRELEAGMNEV